MVYDHSDSASDMTDSCGRTTVDPVNVSYTEGSRDTPQNNIDLFIPYLMDQQGVAPSKIIFSDKHFVTSKADGSITFPKQTFKKTGTYTYTISEVAGDEEGIIYDDTVYTVRVTVEKVNGNYAVTEEVISKDRYAVDAVTFENKTLEDIPDEDTPLAPGNGGSGGQELEDLEEPEVPLATVPATGDMSALWMAMSALSGTGLAAVSFLGRKKRDDEE